MIVMDIGMGDEETQIEEARQIGSHQDMCEERYQMIHGTMADIKTSLNTGLSRIHGRVDRILWSIIAGLGMIALTLITGAIQWIGNSAY